MNVGTVLILRYFKTFLALKFHVKSYSICVNSSPGCFEKQHIFSPVQQQPKKPPLFTLLQPLHAKDLGLPDNAYKH
jgi:hypothetical protein